jgi:hypothetical protein
MLTISYKLIDIDEYLLPATLEWCRQILASEDIDLFALKGGNALFDGAKLHKVAYLRLRQHVHNYIHLGTQPTLQETPSPEGGYEFYERKGRAVAQLVRENAQTIIHEICTLPITPGPELDSNWIREDLSV